jgi:hypothetical protein
MTTHCLLAHLRQIIKNTRNTLAVNKFHKIVILALAIKQIVKLDVIATQPVSCIRVNPIQPQIWPSGTDPHLNAILAQATRQLIGTWEARHRTLHATLSVCQLDLPVRALAHTQRFVELKLGLGDCPPCVGVVLDLMPRPHFSEPVRPLIVIPKRAVNVNGDNRFHDRTSKATLNAS